MAPAGSLDIPTWLSEEAQEYIRLALTQDPEQRPDIKQLMRMRWIEMHRRRNSVLTPGAGLSLKDSPAYQEALAKMKDMQASGSGSGGSQGMPSPSGAGAAGPAAGGGGGLASHISSSLAAAGKSGLVRGSGAPVPGQRSMSTLGMQLVNNANNSAIKRPIG